jgi:aminoglycoside phosphotransferase family enzyme/predicted kinase
VAPKIGGEGPAIEYCVRMRRFDQTDLMSHVVESGRLQPRHIDDLALTVADFHRRIPSANGACPLGGHAAVADAGLANFTAIESLDDPPVRASIEPLRNWSQNELRLREPCLNARKRAGFVRECHGDMHLGNMILSGDKVTIFDCIEFNDQLRWIDVMSEVAFLFMDLEHRGHVELARRFLNRWLEETGDYEGLEVLPLFLVYRALVRAKVARLSIDHASQTADARRAAMNELRAYLNLAAQYTRRPHPFLAITHGVSGSGKSYGAQLLIEQSGAIRIRSDIERKRLAGSIVAAHDAASLYSAEATLQTYSRLVELAEAIILSGFPVIIDATFLKRDERTRFRALAERFGLPFVILDFAASPEVCRKRIVPFDSVSEAAAEISRRAAVQSSL